MVLTAHVSCVPNFSSAQSCSGTLVDMKHLMWGTNILSPASSSEAHCKRVNADLQVGRQDRKMKFDAIPPMGQAVQLRRWIKESVIGNRFSLLEFPHHPETPLRHNCPAMLSQCLSSLHWTNSYPRCRDFNLSVCSLRLSWSSKVGKDKSNEKGHSLCSVANFCSEEKKKISWFHFHHVERSRLSPLLWFIPHASGYMQTAWD